MDKTKITNIQILSVREKSGCFNLPLCKEALQISRGDENKAVQLIRGTKAGFNRAKHMNELNYLIQSIQIGVKQIKTSIDTDSLTHSVLSLTLEQIYSLKLLTDHLTEILNDD